MVNRPKFSCIIIGEGTLPLQCAEILYRRGHTIYGVISPDAPIKEWATARNIPYLEPSGPLIEFVSRQPFDYLFSVVNNYILPPAVLRQPRRWAINYHDAPLPCYAGTHATSWALMQLEKRHGLSWHIMTEQVDAGDILKQHLFDLSPDETALTLNVKCYTAAINTFAELVDELAEGRAVPRPQNLTERTYFSLFRRPPAGCVLSWSQSAERLDAFVRALTFGPYPNPLGLPKLAIGGEFFIIPRLENVEQTNSSSPKNAPGTILAINADSLTIATATYPVALRQLLTHAGQPLSLAEFVTRFNLQVGDQLAELRDDLADRLTIAYNRYCRHEAFWVKRLAALQPITLPYEKIGKLENEQGKVSSLETLPVTIPGEVNDFLAAQEPVWRLDYFLLAAFALYLARLKEVYTFDLGFKPAQPFGELAGIERFFADYLPLRLEAQPSWSFAQLYQAISAELKIIDQGGLYAGDVIPRYPDLATKPELTGGATWPVAVEFAQAGLSNSLSRSKQADRLSYQSLSEIWAPPALTLVISPPAGQWVYDPRIFDEAGLIALTGQFTTLLQSIAANKERPLYVLSLLSPTEQHRLLVEWNNTGADYPRDRCFHQLFEAQAEQTPHAVAVVYENQTLTYMELNRRANQLAHHLQGLGVKPETFVGIYLERSPEMLVGVLGVLKAGGAYLPLDPAYPTERLAFMLADAQVPVLLTQKRLLKKLPAHPAQLLCLDADWPVIGQSGADNPIGDFSPDHLAYVIYTSGSTGWPKGTMVSQRGLLNYLWWAKQVYPVAAGQGAPIHSSLAFDLTITGLFLPLLAGRRVILLPETTGAETLTTALSQESDFSLVKLTPAHLELLSQQLPSLPVDGRPHSFIIGGEALRGETLAFWQTYAPDTRLINEYGPTETVVGCCIYEVPTGERLSGAVPIGCPIANTQLYVLDCFLQPTPVEISGELYIGGDGVARGYLNRPDLTAEKFIPNPFSCEPGARLYKTGDLARYRPDGQLEFLGRIDHQVKIRGFRIELGEIETVIRRHPAIEGAAVLALGDTPTEMRLVAYLVTKEEQGRESSTVSRQGAMPPLPSLSDLRRFLQTKLPDYMLPSTFIWLKALPLTPNGKIDRRALPVPDTTRPGLTETYMAPRSPVEQSLTELWRQIFGLGQVGINDNFFELGGHSLLATQFISRLREALGVDLPLRHLFETPTIAGLAERLETIQWAAPAVPHSLTPSPENRDEREEGEL